MKKRVLLLISFVTFSFGVMAQTDVSGNIGNATWTTAGSPYTVTGNITINAGATLTIETGTVVQFNADTYVQVYGTLNANGATFTANASTTKGFWTGIYAGYEYENAVANVSLNNCTVEYAQQIYVRKGTLALTTNTTLSNFSKYGVEIYAAGILNIDNTTITGCYVPVHFRSGNNGNWNVGENVSFTDNAWNVIRLDCDNIVTDLHLYNLSVDYYYGKRITIKNTGVLTIHAGVSVTGNTNASIDVRGKFKALGTQTDSVKFCKESNADYWKGIKFYDEAVDTACIFNYTKFTDVLQNSNNSGYTTVYIEKSSPHFSNCVFSNNHYNLKVKGRSMPVFNDCYFGSSVAVAKNIKNINLDMNEEPVFNNCDIEFNNLEGRAVGLVEAKVYDDSHLKKLNFNGYENITYVMIGKTTVLDTASLTIDPGVVIKCADHGVYLRGYGAINGIGTEAEPIVFTYINDDDYGNPADTYNDGTTTLNHSVSGRLFIYSSQATSHLKYWKIIYAGYDRNNYVMVLKHNNILENCLISNSYRGVVFSENAQLINNTFENIDYYAVSRFMDYGNPVLLGNTIYKVGYNGIYINRFWTGDYEIGPLDFAGNENVAYILEDKEIPEDANVTLLPGTVIKVLDGYSRGLTVKGGLKAEGTADKKVIFTSIYDNSVGGNTNYNSGTDPATKKWGRLTFTETSNDTLNSLKNVELRYFENSLLIDNCNIEIDNVILNFSNNYGVTILGEAATVITNSQFNNINKAPVQMDLFSNVSFSGNSVANVGRAGISINGGTIKGTVPVRSFAGYDNITYFIEDRLNVDDELTIPAGLVFKGTEDRNNYILISGKLTVQGTVDNPVVFTTLDDDEYGNPSDSENNGQGAITNHGCGISFGRSSDSCTVDHTLFRYMFYRGIYTGDASPVISNCTFYKPTYEGIMMRGTSAPTITGCTFEDNPFPVTIDPTCFPGSESGNQLTGTTGKGILLFDNATLSQDATLSKHGFAGIDNIPYIFKRYTIGTSGKLTVEPGVVCKFTQNGFLNVKKGLIAKGGSTPDSIIVFTSDRDDFYGGDTYSDGDANVANDRWWRGIYFYGESIDDECVLDNCVVKNGTYYYTDHPHSYNFGAVTVDNSSPTITNTRFEDDRWGILARNTSLPVVNNCDFIGMDPAKGYGIWNETGTVTVVAENCWWDDSTGPYNAASNPSGKGVRVSDNVDFDPWIAQPSQPAMGDVSLNGEIMPYDASLVMQSSVGNIVLNETQKSVADVSYNGEISSYDASMILQYTAGLITAFEQPSGINMLKSTGREFDVTVSVTVDRMEPEQRVFELPVSFTTGEGVKAMDMAISSDVSHVRFVELRTPDIPTGVMVSLGYDENSGVIKISAASANDLELQNNDFILVFEFVEGDVTESEVQMIRLEVNEIANTGDFIVSIGSSHLATGINESVASSVKIFAHGNKCNADIDVNGNGGAITVYVFNISGLLTNKIEIKDAGSGTLHLSFNLNKTGYMPGVYIVKVKGDDFAVTRKLVVK